MEIKASHKHLGISPRKTRLVADLIKKKQVGQARSILNFAGKRGAEPILKLLNSAVASAKNNFQIDEANLYISKITVDGGPTHKRWRPRSRGMAHPIKKRTSHVTLILDEIVKGEKSKKPAKKPEKKPVKEAEPAEKKTKEKVKFDPAKEIEKPKPKTPTGLKKFFRRKSI